MDAKGLRERITSGLIVWALVTIFIQPLLSLAWRTITVVGGFVHQGYVDRIYRNAAISGLDPYGRSTLFVVLIVILLAAMWAVGADLKEFGPSINLFVKFTWIVFVIMFCLAIIGKLAILDGTANITASFTQRLTVLAPAITDAECKSLKARWASMQGKADYDALVTAMDTRAAQLGIKLPPVRPPGPVK